MNGAANPLSENCSQYVQDRNYIAGLFSISGHCARILTVGVDLVVCRSTD
jgi:hypothetical protein